jgi:hypothetical protein
LNLRRCQEANPVDLLGLLRLRSPRQRDSTNQQEAATVHYSMT